MIHPHTYIHPNAKLATNVKIDPFTVIHHNVEIGEGTWIGSNVTIMEGARIGKNCRIFPGAVIAASPQDLKFEGEDTTVEIGDNTTIREFVTIHRGTKDRWKTVVGKNCLIMAYSHIAHDCIVGNNCIMSNNTQMAGQLAEWQALTGDWKNLFLYLQKLEKVTPADVQRVAKLTFTPGNRTIAVIEPLETAEAK